MAARVERLLTAAVGGDPHVTLNVRVQELLGDASAVTPAISQVLTRAGPGLTPQLRLQKTLRAAGVVDDLLNSTTSADPGTRIAAARLCGALRLSDSVPWLSDMLNDPKPKVREAAIRGLGELGGHRAVDALMAATDRIPQHRLAIELARAASDMDIEALMREPASVQVAVVTVLACGLRHDTLRVGPLSAIARDRRWPIRVRVAACRSLGMIGDASASGALAALTSDPDAAMRGAAIDAQRRLKTAPESPGE